MEHTGTEDKRMDQIAKLVVDAYAYGAANENDIYAYVRQYVVCSKKEITITVFNIFGPITRAPENYLLN